MFSFGNKAYVQLDKFNDPNQPHENGGTAGNDVEGGSTRAEMVPVAPVVPTATAASNMGGDSGRVQVPIGMVSDSRLMRQWQTMALVAFTLIQVMIFIGLCILVLMLDGYGRVAVMALGGGSWLALLLFNLRMANRPRKVIQWFLQTKPKTKLSSSLRKRRGTVVVIKGTVSLLHEELLSTEFHNVPGLVLVESSLRSYHPGVKRNDAWTEHVRQTRAVDFRITDSLSGATALVRAFSASEAGAATPLVHISTEVPLSTAVPISPPGGSQMKTDSGGSGPKPVDTDERRRRKLAAAPQLMVCKGYIRQGQSVTVMGELSEVPGSSELCISALSTPHNISKFLLYRHFLPFFFPTWVSGLVISDQRDLA